MCASEQACISQGDLRKLLAVQELAAVLVEEFDGRIAAGAAIEPGPLAYAERRVKQEPIYG